MDKAHYEEMVSNLEQLIQEKAIQNKKIYLFGHCNATEELANLLGEKGFCVAGILDNNTAKQGKQFQRIPIQPPQAILAGGSEQTVVCIVARAYAEMAEQLIRLGYGGKIYKLADYNSYAEYSLSEQIIARRRKRVEEGILLLRGMAQEYPDCFRILCPFSALGDVYFAMSYLSCFMRNKGIGKCLVCVVGRACAEVVRLFDGYKVLNLAQEDMDKAVQAVLYTGDENSFIAHQDRPYVINLHKALSLKCIPLEQMYCCGVFGLLPGTLPAIPTHWSRYENLDSIESGRAVILSPYAKSVPIFPGAVWEAIVEDYHNQGCQLFTNVAGEEKHLPGTLPISPGIREMKSVVEQAGTFIGIRSGICDVIRTAQCRKIALYPDYNYCDTRWKAVEMYSLEGWENIVIGDGFHIEEEHPWMES